MADKKVDAIVISAGAGGGVVAKELAVNGFSVVLMERGGWPDYDQHIHDELISQRVQDLGSTFGPDWEKHPRVMVDEHGNRHQIHAGHGAYGHVAACVGSGTVSYGAMGWRFMKEDFQLKSIYGMVEDSTLDDWPVTYEELEPYYVKAEWEIGVSGDHSLNPFAPPQSKPLPMPPFEFNREGTYLAEVCKRMGLHPFPIPMLRNSVPYHGRPACIRNRTCCGYACPVDAKNGTHNTVIPTAVKTGNCEVRTHCVVAEILVDDRGKATGVRYFDEKGKGRTMEARIVVVAGSATETARLLLNSKSRLFPHEAGNNNDWVGRNLQGHAYTGASGLFDFDILDLAGPGACMAICDYNHHNEGIIGGGLLATEFYTLPYAFSQNRPSGEPRWGIAHKNYQRENFYRLGRLVGPIQEIPHFEARVTVDPAVKDHWGIPVATLSGNRHPADIKHCAFLAEKAEQILKEAGACRTWQHGGGYGLSGGQHQAGTCRMGNDPRTSVTNKYGQLHEIDNLFVADGSLLVTNGGFNPALTIMALGYWVGDYIVKTYQ
ncbi:MAG: GMC family oxidoreductase [Tannerellaceae bacterium]|nr:GMC family oxidoreductase [Tannerellaceae bacterium]